MILNPPNLQAAFLAFNTRFQTAYSKTPTYWERVASQETSTTEQERYAWLDRIPALRKWTGDRFINNLSGRVQTITNDLFEDTVGIERTKFEDDTYRIYAPSVDMLGDQSRRWPDQLVWAALQAGTSVVTYDNANFFDSSHPINPDNAAGGVQANSFVSLPLNADNYQTVRSAMRSLLGPDGLPLNVEPDLLVVPTDLERTARTILNAETIAVPVAAGVGPGGVAAQTNVLKGTADVLVVPYLPNGGANSAWYLMDTRRAIKPLLFQLRAAPEFSYLNRPTDPTVFLQDKYLYGVRARGAAGYGLWWTAARATGLSS
jgi:phage major head subunit gpT-like protein